MAFISSLTESVLNIIFNFEPKAGAATSAMRAIVIVCFCVTSSDRDIAEAIDAGAHTVEQVGRTCGAGTGCGSCRGYIRDMIDSCGARCPPQCRDCPRLATISDAA
jgi:bacterioferritin-associated ferredoxin